MTHVWHRGLNSKYYRSGMLRLIVLIFNIPPPSLCNILYYLNYPWYIITQYIINICHLNNLVLHYNTNPLITLTTFKLFDIPPLIPIKYHIPPHCPIYPSQSSIPTLSNVINISYLKNYTITFIMFFIKYHTLISSRHFSRARECLLYDYRLLSRPVNTTSKYG